MSVVSRTCPALRGARAVRDPFVRLAEPRVARDDVAREEVLREEAVREDDAREVDLRVAAVFPAFADALFCVRGAAMGAQSVV
jgi:hypothetical protein